MGSGEVDVKRIHLYQPSGSCRILGGIDPYSLSPPEMDDGLDPDVVPVGPLVEEWACEPVGEMEETGQ